jgi:hypothetical protein
MFQVVRAIGPSKGPAVFANGVKPATPPFLVRALGGLMALKR